MAAQKPWPAVTLVREALYRETPGFYHVNVGGGREVPVAKGIGADRLSPEQAIDKGRRIAAARGWKVA